jgi:hypothetical protein
LFEETSTRSLTGTLYAKEYLDAEEAMTRSIVVEIDSAGRIQPVDGSPELRPGRAILVWPPTPEEELLLLAEPALALNWLGDEEDAAWAHLQPVK